jgi:dihydrofolate reductase
MMFFSLILACTLDGGIGVNNAIPWTIKEEMTLFKKITTDVNCYVKKNAVIMGRNTWSSLPMQPLKNRINIIITSTPGTINTNGTDILAFKDLEEAFEFCESNIYIDKVFVIGGKSLYDLCLNDDRFLKRIDNIHLSVIKSKYECDTFVDFKKIVRTFRNYNMNDIIFNSKFLYIKYKRNG